MIGLAALFSTAIGVAVTTVRRPEEYNLLRAHLGAYGHDVHDKDKSINYRTFEPQWAKIIDNAKIIEDGSRHVDASGAIFDLRRRSGLTVKQIADILGVSPKTIHNWQNGNVISSANMEHLGRILDAVRFVDRGEGALTRAMLLTSGNGSGILLEMLKNKRFAEFRALAGQGAGRVDSRKFLMSTKPSESAGEQLQILSDDNQVAEPNNEFNFRMTEFDLKDDDWT